MTKLYDIEYRIQETQKQVKQNRHGVRQFVDTVFRFTPANTKGLLYMSIKKIYGA